jgi:PTS system nitrogen regulatory IIA component
METSRRLQGFPKFRNVVSKFRKIASGYTDVSVGVSAPTKARALQIISTKASEALGVEAQPLLSMLAKRELLGSTGIGRGIAVPDAPLPELGPPRSFIFNLSGN